ncbi:hypothetical protein MUP77_18970 [Candidatus Bathyarchaeota archaeon]|nr:hypothetical protein [Candidatus Bathyarchaeota archaeon]
MVDLDERSKDTQDTVRSKKEKARKPAANTESNTANIENTMENASEPLSDASVLDVENEMQKLVPHRRELSESDLKREQERLGKIKIAQEMLQTGWSVREVSQELKLPKSLIEKLSKKLSASESRPRGYGYREEYLQRPYRRALQESEDEDEDLVEWARKENVKIMKMTIQMGMMRRNGLLGSDDGASTQTQKIDINSILIAKALGNNGGTKEMAEMLNLFKSMGLLGEPKADDFMQKYAAMESLKDSAVAKNNAMQTQAFQQAKASADQGFTKEIVGKLVDAAAPFVKNLTVRPVNIPGATEATASIPPPLAGPTQAELESLSLPLHPEPLQGVPVLDDSAVGYSNLNKPDLTKKSELR